MIWCLLVDATFGKVCMVWRPHSLLGFLTDRIMLRFGEYLVSIFDTPFK
jgi:hypothetical protein